MEAIGKTRGLMFVLGYLGLELPGGCSRLLCTPSSLLFRHPIP